MGLGGTGKLGLDGNELSMIDHKQAGAFAKLPAGRMPIGRMAALLLGSSILAGIPVGAAAQETAAAQAPAPVAAPAPASNVIRSIAIVGSQRLEPQTILSYIRLRVGQTYTSAAADGALKDLGATELFSNFSIRNDAGNVVITVTENPVINRIVLEGNKRIKNDKIVPEIKLSARQIFTRSK
ncbi:MAG: POTRA domain-containing protein, partial [Marinomonas sp.]